MLIYNEHWIPEVSLTPVFFHRCLPTADSETARAPPQKRTAGHGLSTPLWGTPSFFLKSEPLGELEAEWQAVIDPFVPARFPRYFTFLRYPRSDLGGSLCSYEPTGRNLVSTFPNFPQSITFFVPRAQTTKLFPARERTIRLGHASAFERVPRYCVEPMNQ